MAKPLDPFSDTDPAAQIDSRLIALCDEFGIDGGDPERFKKLALALAFKHVPAFRLPEKWVEWERTRGQRSGPKKDTLSDKKALVVIEVEDALKETKGVTRACRTLTRGKHMKFNAESEKLERAYYRYNNNLKGLDWLSGGAPLRRLCAKYPEPCAFGKPLHDPVALCQQPHNCRLRIACLEFAQQFSRDAAEAGPALKRLRAWRSMTELAMPNEDERRGRTK